MSSLHIRKVDSHINSLFLIPVLCSYVQNIISIAQEQFCILKTGKYCYIRENWILMWKSLISWKKRYNIKMSLWCCVQKQKVLFVSQRNASWSTKCLKKSSLRFLLKYKLYKYNTLTWWKEKYIVLPDAKMKLPQYVFFHYLTCMNFTATLYSYLSHR